VIKIKFSFTNIVRLIHQKAKGKDVVYCQNSEIVPPHLREGRENLGHYLAGLIEGDGSIIVPRTSRNEKGKLLYPTLFLGSLVSYIDERSIFFDI